jgi:hypothetical protein
MVIVILMIKYKIENKKRLKKNHINRHYNNAIVITKVPLMVIMVMMVVMIRIAIVIIVIIIVNEMMIMMINRDYKGDNL